MHYGQLRKLERVKEAFRSGLEKKVTAALDAQGIDYGYESVKVAYMVPSRPTFYTPDIVLANGILIECKGVFESADRTKHLAIKAQYPDLDIRFVFSRSSSPLRKGSPTDYAQWCHEHGFKYADKLIPQEWLDECPGTSLAHITRSVGTEPTTTSGTQTKALSSKTSKSTKAKRPTKKRASSTSTASSSTET